MTIAAEMCCHCEPQPSPPVGAFVIQHDLLPLSSSRTDGAGCFASVAFEDNGDNAASNGIELLCCSSCTLLRDFSKTWSNTCFSRWRKLMNTKITAVMRKTANLESTIWTCARNLVVARASEASLRSKAAQWFCYDRKVSAPQNIRSLRGSRTIGSMQVATCRHRNSVT
jgi:hypothetical protein